MDKKRNPKQQSLFETTTKSQEATMPENQSNKVNNQSNKINLLDVTAAESTKSLLEKVRLGKDETAIIPFTKECVAVDVHYCSETELNSYVVCNGPDCLLCRIGRKRDSRLLLPVYLPAAGCVGILPVSRSLRPFALLPQISNVLKADKPMVMFVTRDGGKHVVSTADLQKDVDGGEVIIRHFDDEYEAGLHDLTAIYPRIDNEQLADVEDIGRMMSLKGVRVHADDKRS